MYGLIVKIHCLPGQREAMALLLVEGTAGMPGCRSYVVARDNAEPDSLWVTQVWDSEESHKASLSIPSVEQTLTKVKALIADIGGRFETTPVARPESHATS